MKKKKIWLRPRHAFWTAFLMKFVGAYAKIKYRIKVSKFKDQGKRPYLILLNHQTSFDQFFVAMAFKGAVYYVASEDLFSMGFASKVINYLVKPIPIKKQTTDARASMTCVKIAREGGTIALAPEGNRTFSGKTEYINPSIVKLAKLIKLPIAFFRIEGGYGVQPRWSNVKRKGKMRAFVSKVLEPEEFLKMSDDELFNTIKTELNVFEAKADGNFYHKKSAEYLERAVYVCPKCGLSTFYSKGQLISCKNCNLTAKYLPDKRLSGEGEEFPFEFVNDWYEYQNEFINKFNPLEHTDKPLYSDKVKFFIVHLYKNKEKLSKKAIAELYGDKIVVKYGGKQDEFLFNELTAVTVLGKNKVNFYFNDQVYQIKGDKRFNALRYVNIFYRHKNLTAGGKENNGEFLGL